MSVSSFGSHALTGFDDVLSETSDDIPLKVSVLHSGLQYKLEPR